ncbi:GGDEF domain-containing protein [Vibrio sp. RC27]
MDQRLFKQSDELRTSVLIGVSLFLTCTGLFFSVYHLIYGGDYFVTLIEATFSIFSGIIYTLLKQGKSTPLFNCYYAYLLIGVLILCTLTQPLSGGLYIWACAAPSGLYLLMGLRHATVAVAGVLLIQTVIILLFHTDAVIVQSKELINVALCYCGIWIISYRYESSRTIIENSLLYLASRDQLTNAHNRLSLNTVFNHYKSHRSKNPQLYLLVLDIDYFKKINDSHGHDVGDKVLIDVTLLLATLVGEDNVFRIGGEEFCITLFDMDLKQASEIGELLRTSVANNRFNIGGIHIPITLSIGICKYSQQNQLSDLLKLADVELYKAKRNGRNQVCICQQSSEDILTTVMNTTS